MAFPKDTRVTVDSVNDTYINVSIGPNGYQIDKGELAQLMSGQMDDFETIKRNMATALVLAGVDVQDDIAIKATLENRTFKAFL